VTTWLEYALRAFEPPRWPTPGAMAAEFDQRNVQTPALDLIDAALTEWAETPDGRLIISMPPQEGKSTRAGHWMPVWLLQRYPSWRIVMASYAAQLAYRNSRLVRNTIADFPELGLSLAEDRSAVHDWELALPRGARAGGMYSVGVGGGVSGRPADALIIDDPHKDRQECSSEQQREKVWSWWQSAASARLAPGAPVLVIQTRWHEDDLAGRLTRSDDGWKVLNIPAQSEGEGDPLHRPEGEYMISARRNRDGTPKTVEQWEQRKREAGEEWAPLYQGSPSAKTGTILDPTKLVRYDKPLWAITREGQHVMMGEGVTCIQSWDLSFKGTDKSDRVVGTVWAKKGSSYMLLDLVQGRWGFTETCNAIRALSAKWPLAVAKFVEDKANGPAVMDHLQLEIEGLTPVEPRGGKEVRAHAVSPLINAGNVFVPGWAEWLTMYVTEMRQFPYGRHDDMVDSTTQALSQLMSMGLVGSGGARGLW
jgi:predicted phage terminase large subunit-like protein